MDLDVKKNAFVKLGSFLSQFTHEQPIIDTQSPQEQELFHQFKELINTAVHHNGWFTKEQVLICVESWASALTQENMDLWCSAYDFSKEPLKKVGLILAGNIPLVGFHDVICVLLSGNIAMVKLSSNDKKFLPFIAHLLELQAPEFKQRIGFVEDKLDGFDAVIATGSDNTARYFEYYFSKVPNIIRKNRNSVAVLNQQETPEELIALGKDIFTYFGLGCRNVSKLYLPKGYDFDLFFQGMYPYNEVINYDRYANNYDYNKAVFLMSEFKLLDNGFLTIKEDTAYSSPISSVFYEYYDSLEQLKEQFKEDEQKIQCIVSNDLIPGSIGFGQTQMPQLWDYADNVDTLKFLLNL
ncbi:acyl-CoA reductase [Myroides sp. LJL115]